jgi:hypothetical protein
VAKADKGRVAWCGRRGATGRGATDRQDRSEAGPGGSGRGVREKEGERQGDGGHRHAGPGGTVPGGAVQT